MRDYPIHVAEADFREIERVVEHCCLRLGLIRRMKDTLAKFPGCVHWHFKKTGAKGTLEITSWPAHQRLWITVQDGRRAEWIEEAIPELIAMIEQSLRR